MRPLSQLVKFGNSKLPKTTMIFNMGSATYCPSKALGYCKVDKCYAAKPEAMYPPCKPYRLKQCDYWLNNTAEMIANDMIAIIKRKRIKPDLFRFNESGDFWSQGCVDKLDIIAYRLLDELNIVTYGYTARKDLKFDYVCFRVKSSGYYNGNNGRTIVFNPKTETKPKGYYLCPCDCRVCTCCSSDLGLNIAFPEH